MPMPLGYSKVQAMEPLSLDYLTSCSMLVHSVNSEMKEGRYQGKGDDEEWKMPLLQENFAI